MRKFKSVLSKFLLVGFLFTMMSGPCCSGDENNPVDPNIVEDTTDGSAALEPQLDLPYPQVYAEGVDDLADNPDVSDGSALTFNGQSTIVTRVYSSGGTLTAPFSQTACAYYEFWLTDADTDGLDYWAETDVPEESIFVLINDTLVNPKQISQNAGNNYTTVETEFILNFNSTTTQTVSNGELPQNIEDMIQESSWGDEMTSEILATENYLVQEWFLLSDTDYNLTVTRYTRGDPNPPDESTGAPTYTVLYKFKIK